MAAQSEHDVEAHHVCPWWLGPLLCCPLRRFLEDPETMLAPYVSEGSVVLEPGCGMGYFTLPLARMAGPRGKVVCVDVQPKMIAGLIRRARRAQLADRIDASVCAPDDLGIERWKGRIDLAVAIHMVHETHDARNLLDQIYAALRPGGTLLILEPKGHVSNEDFERTVATATNAGFGLRSSDRIKRDHRAALERP